MPMPDTGSSYRQHNEQVFAWIPSKSPVAMYMSSISRSSVHSLPNPQKLCLRFPSISSIRHHTSVSSKNASSSSKQQVIEPEVDKHGNALFKNARLKQLKVPSLRDFLIKQQQAATSHSEHENSTPSSESTMQVDFPPYLEAGLFNHMSSSPKKVFIETYGCQMNVSDTEIISSVLQGAGYQNTDSDEDADVVLLNTCSIRENAEFKVWKRLDHLRGLRRRGKKGKPVVGVLGCMAERLKTKLLEGEERVVDVVAGPDSYRHLPRLLSAAEEGHAAVNVLLSADETYADIAPVRMGGQNNTSAFVTIMRGCDNMCSYCVVPQTRGVERSRPSSSIEEEIKILVEKQNVKEITLLGQNVNSYCDLSQQQDGQAPLGLGLTADGNPAMSSGFKTIYKLKSGGIRFAELLESVSRSHPETRFRFTSPHPKDFPDDLLQLIAERPNICKSLHMPAQSGSTAVLERMRRGYSREAYDQLVERIRTVIPGCALSSDFISGFCGETDADHEATLDLLRKVKYEHAFLFAYSVREKTHAHRQYADDVPQDVKLKRLQEAIDVYMAGALERNKSDIGSIQLVLVEGTSRRSESDLSGMTDTSKRTVFPIQSIPAQAPAPGNDLQSSGALVEPKFGDYVAVRIENVTPTTLIGTPLFRTSIAEFSRLSRQSNPFVVKQ